MTGQRPALHGRAAARARTRQGGFGVVGGSTGLEGLECSRAAGAAKAGRGGDAPSLARLAAYWRGLRACQFYDSFAGYPEFCIRLCALALEHGIEVELVCNLIDRQGRAAPPDAPDAWPWPLALREHEQALVQDLLAERSIAH